MPFPAGVVVSGEGTVAARHGAGLLGATWIPSQMVDLIFDKPGAPAREPDENSQAGRRVPPPASPQTVRASPLPEHRLLWMLVGLGLLGWSWQLIGSSSQGWTVPFLVVCSLWGLLTIIASWMPEGTWAIDDRVLQVLEWGTALMLVATFVVWGINNIGGLSPYGTDAMAFNQYAAMLAHHGHNPYAFSMRPAFGLFRTPTTFYTYGFNGVPVTTLSYPAQSFLVYVPFLLLGWSLNLAPTVNIMAWALTLLMMFAMVPRRIRPVAILFGAVMVYAQFTVGGVTDVLFMPLLAIAAYRWDRFGSSRLSYIGPVMFGLAMGIKQNPWLALPFVLIALCLDERDRTDLRTGLKRAGRYLAVVVAALMIPNLPYLVASPSDWVKGVVTPMFANMVPTGQGILSLSLYLHVGGGSVTAFSASAALVFIFLLIAFVGTYPLLRGSAYVLPALAFFFADRSNMNYFISLIPVGFIAVSTVQHPHFQLRENLGRAHARAGGVLAGAVSGLSRLFRSGRWALAAAVVGLAAVATVAYSLTAPQPLRIRIVGVQTTGTNDRIVELSVLVTNRSHDTVKPGFDVVRGGYNSTFWLITSGARTLRPGQSTTYTMLAPDAASQPSVYGGFQVVGYVDAPKSFSASANYRPILYHMLYSPSAVDHVVPVGKPMTLSVQVFQVNGTPLRRAGVLVLMGEVVFTDTGIRRGSVRINGGSPGRKASSFTNRQGIASFQLLGTAPTPYPVAFTASLINAKYGYRYSDSGTIDIRFGP
ncbi:MAG: hypothetical protein ACP5H2_02515 [Solirubrobacteraceae bacterium]